MTVLDDKVLFIPYLKSIYLSYDGVADLEWNLLVQLFVDWGLWAGQEVVEARHQVDF